MSRLAILIIVILITGSIEEEDSAAQQQNVLCTCDQFNTQEFCEGFGCFWNLDTQQCSEMTCKERGTTSTCYQYNRLPRLRDDPIICELIKVEDQYLKCQESNKDCESMTSQVDNPNCKWNACGLDENNESCITPNSECSKDRKSCDGMLLIEDKQVSGFCVLKGKGGCKQIDIDTSCQSIDDQQECIYMSILKNCAWKNYKCIELECSDRYAGDCDSHYYEDIYTRCIKLGANCVEVTVESLDQDRCVSDSLQFWDEEFLRCRSCDTTVTNNQQESQRWNKTGSIYHSEDHEPSEKTPAKSILVNLQEFDVVRGSAFNTTGFGSIFPAFWISQMILLTVNL